MAIKEPYLTFDEQKLAQLRIDHPSDIVVLTPSDTSVLSKWRSNNGSSKTASQLKDEGNMNLKKGGFHAALECYTEGLVVSDAQDVRRDLCRNRSLVNLRLRRYDSALADALAALSDRKSVSVSDDQTKQLDSKALYRAGCAAYNLRDFQAARTSTNNPGR